MSLPQGTAKFILKPACRLPPLPHTQSSLLYITKQNEIKSGGKWCLAPFYISDEKSK